MATTVPVDIRLPGLTSFTRPEDKRINARISDFGPKTPRTDTELVFSAPFCVAALVTVAFDMNSGLTVVARPLVMSGWLPVA